MTQYIARFDPVNLGAVIPVPPLTSGSGPAFPGLLVYPGIYSYNGVDYDMTEQGLYVFHHPHTPEQQWRDGGWRIVYAGDFYLLMQAVATLCVYGAKHNGLSNTIKTNTARSTKLSMQCGDTINWARHLVSISTHAFPTRIARVLTALTPNGWDEGHVLLEAFVDGAWRLWDLAFDRFYVSSKGEHLSLLEYADSSPVSPLSVTIAKGQVDNGNDEAGIHCPANAALQWGTEERIQEWLDDKFQIFGLDSNGLTYWYLPQGAEDRASWVLGLDPSYRVVSRETWIQMFYQ